MTMTNQQAQDEVIKYTFRAYANTVIDAYVNALKQALTDSNSNEGENNE